MKGLRVYGIWGLLLLVALLPRLFQLGRFITADEILFLDHAREFLQGLTTGDLWLTLGIGYPGVTLAWANALGLLVLYGLSKLRLVGVPSANLSLSQFLAGADVQPLPYYVAGRAVSAVLVTVLLLLFYTLARRLLVSERHSWGRLVALLSVFLLALDPYVLGYSRLMHIAVPLALLMLLTVMAWMLWLGEGQKRWSGLAGVFFGLALLTKSTALLLFPILLGLALLHWLVVGPIRGQSGRTWWAWSGRVLVAWLGVLGVAALVFFLLWPVMWQNPVAAWGLTFGKLWVDKEAGQGNLGMFWMGRFVDDPGPAFYVVATLLKLSPLMLIGLVVSLVSLRPTRERGAELGLWAYALLYLLVMTVAAKKSVRYMLPAFVAFAPLAAYGLIRLGRWAANTTSGRHTDGSHRAVFVAAFSRRPLLLVLVLLLLVALTYAPYYLSYYNPLLIGWRWATKAILVGWGEGLGDAARFLNQRPGAERAKVAAWYDWTFAPFFVGQTLPLSTENAMAADHSVFYINQVQRDIPDPNLITYFQRRQPEHVVRLNGIEYVWIYPAISSDGPLPASAIPVGVPMGDAVVLEGYEARPDSKGQGIIVTLYWRALRSELPDYFVYVRSVDDTGQIYARADSPPVMGFWPTSRWEGGKLVADEQVLTRPPETEPGTYRLEVGMYDPQTWAVLEPASGERGEGGGVLLGEVMLP
jgi:4-amino-4-deoxy-L-arabinose transferase-like glycosyltransferase